VGQFLRAGIPEFCLKFGWIWPVYPLMKVTAMDGTVRRRYRRATGAMCAAKSALLRSEVSGAVEVSAPADFWAPGYLGGQRSQRPRRMIHDYIHKPAPSGRAVILLKR
jgi:hypothetical protein